MGRGCGWTDVELGHVARAWVYASEDPIVGIDQTAGRFRSTMFQKFKEMAPVGSNEKTYGGRTPKSVRAKFDEISADVQKFRSAIKRVQSCNPTGVTINEIISMSIAVHLGKRDSMSYEARGYPHTQWRNHLAYAVLKTQPKFCDESVSSSTLQLLSTQTAEPPSEIEETIVGSTGQSSRHLEVGNASNTGTQTSAEKDVGDAANTSDMTKEHRPQGRKASKFRRSVEQHRSKAVENSRQIALSLNRRNELSEERTALLAYRREECETQEDLEDRAEYLRLLRKERLRALRQRISGTERGTPRPRLDTDASSAAENGSGGSGDEQTESQGEQSANMVEGEVQSIDGET